MCEAVTYPTMTSSKQMRLASVQAIGVAIQNARDAFPIVAVWF
jgi:hypothetical protein